MSIETKKLIQAGLGATVILFGPTGYTLPPPGISSIAEQAFGNQASSKETSSSRAIPAKTQTTEKHPLINSIIQFAEVPDTLYTKMGVGLDDPNKDSELYLRLWTSSVFSEPLQKFGTQFSRGTFNNINLHFRTNTSTEGYSFWVETENDRILAYVGYDNDGNNGFWVSAPRGAKITPSDNGDIPIAWVKDGFFTPMIVDSRGNFIDPKTGVRILSDRNNNQDFVFMNDFISHQDDLISLEKEQISMYGVRQPLSFTLFETFRDGEKSVMLNVVDRYDSSFALSLSW